MDSVLDYGGILNQYKEMIEMEIPNKEKVEKYLRELYYTRSEDIDPYTEPKEMGEFLIKELQTIMEAE